MFVFCGLEVYDIVDFREVSLFHNWNYGTPPELYDTERKRPARTEEWKI